MAGDGLLLHALGHLGQGEQECLTLNWKHSAPPTTRHTPKPRMMAPPRKGCGRFSLSASSKNTVTPSSASLTSARPHEAQRVSGAHGSSGSGQRSDDITFVGIVGPACNARDEREEAERARGTRTASTRQG